jgi:hypothetical protein
MQAPGGFLAPLSHLTLTLSPSNAHGSICLPSTQSRNRDRNRIRNTMDEDTPWEGLENGIDDPEELQVIYRTLDSFQ